MGFTDSLLPLVSLLFLSSTTVALPQPYVQRHHRHHHHHHVTGSYPTATGYPTAAGTGTGGVVTPTGYYPIGNWTYSGASGSASYLSGTAYPTTGPYPTTNLSGTAYPTTDLPGTAYPITELSTTAYSAAPSASVSTSVDESKAITPTSSTSTTGMIRGVNIGSWLVLEPWMASSLFTGAAADAQDQWSYDSTSGALANLQNHWATWFTETDVQTLQSYGFNA